MTSPWRDYKLILHRKTLMAILREIEQNGVSLGKNIWNVESQQCITVVQICKLRLLECRVLILCGTTLWWWYLRVIVTCNNKNSNTSLELLALCQFGVKGLHQKVPDFLHSSGYIQCYQEKQIMMSLVWAVNLCPVLLCL